MTPSSGNPAAGLPASLTERIWSDFSLRPVTAAEIEFYLRGGAERDEAAMVPFWQRLQSQCEAERIPLFKMEKERGPGQHEVALGLATPEQSVRQTEALKQIVTLCAQAQGMAADFSAKPFPDQPGSGLHIHLHLEDGQGRNVFTRDPENGQYSDALRFAVAGLLAALPESMPLFAPSAASYARFQPGGNAPVTVSWGPNNRTVALRLPDKPPGAKHLEHRVAGADAPVGQAMAAILAGLHHGLSAKAGPPAQIFGDASLAMYALPPLPRSLEEAQAARAAGNILPRYFSLLSSQQAN